LVIVLNKVDQQKYEDLKKEERELIESCALDNNTFLLKMSNKTGDGVADVKSKACDILLEYRLNNKSKGNTEKVIENLQNRIYIAQPSPRDNKKRPTNIPNSVLEEKKRNPLPEGVYEKQINHNRIKEMQENNGGAGVFYIPDKEHFILEKPEWKNDIIPEIMDGKNIFDFIDPDIKEKLERLEEEEDRIKSQMKDEDMDMDDDEEDEDELSEDLLDLHEQVMKDKEKIKQRHEQVKKSTLPRRVRDLTETERMMVEIRQDKKDVIENLKFLGTTKKRERDEKRKSIEIYRKEKKKTESESEEDCGLDNMMDIDDDGNTNNDNGLSKLQKAKLRKLEKMKIKTEQHNNEIQERLKRKIQKNWSSKARINEADRSIPSKLPKHLNSGVRGMGKTDRR
jgi:nucleolar GTP-binding protein